MIKKVEKVTIVGGGTAGWMAAAAISRLLGPAGVTITLIESAQIGTVGVGEATLPHIRFFNQRIGIDETAFIKATQATIKLGIQFCDWARIGDAYIHPFGDYGRPVGDIGFHHLWRRHALVAGAGRICDYSLPVVMAEQNRFSVPTPDPDQLLGSFSYAYQMDAGLYAQFLRRFAEGLGVRRIEGRIVDVSVDPMSGFVTAVRLDDDRMIGGDLFVDCSGFRGLLIEKTLDAGFDDWSGYLPCDRAVAMPCDSVEPPVPYTRATARPAGWQWRIPLQHRVGNGYVYCSDHISDQEAADDLLRRLDGAPRADPLFVRFQAGQRKRQWIGNTVAIGLSSGFLEPLESTSIYLIQAAITALVELFPNGAIDTEDADEFNRVMALEYERVRDFLVLHYHATERDDTPFWTRVRTMAIPASLEEKMALFRERGHVLQYKDGLFLEPSWLAVYLGQRIIPDGYDPRIDGLNADRARTYLAGLKEEIRRNVGRLPPHQAFLDGIAGQNAAPVTE